MWTFGLSAQPERCDCCILLHGSLPCQAAATHAELPCHTADAKGPCQPKQHRRSLCSKEPSGMARCRQQRVPPPNLGKLVQLKGITCPVLAAPELLDLPAGTCIAISADYQQEVPATQCCCHDN